MDVATWKWPHSLPNESITPPSQNWQCTSIPMYLVAVDLAVVVFFVVVVAMSRLLLPDTRPTRGRRRQRTETTQPRTSYIFRRRHYGSSFDGIEGCNPSRVSGSISG